MTALPATYEPQLPPAPVHLRPETAAWWVLVVEEFGLEQHHLKLLRLACEAWDRGQSAREVLEKDGLTFTDRWSQPKARPEVAIERDARIGFARLLRELGLDIAPPAEAPRPPILRHSRRGT